MDDIYQNIKDHNPNKKRKCLLVVLIVFGNIIADMLNNKKYA